jgi:hypothetical protein
MRSPTEAGVPNPRNLLIAFALGTLVIAGAAAGFVMASRPDSEARERAIRQALGLAQTEEYVYAYPVTGTPVAFDPRCDRICAERQMPAGKTLVQTGPRPQGFLAVDPPPQGCAMLSLRFSDATAAEINSDALPVFLDAAPLEDLQFCNPDAPLRRNEGGLVQVPPWYRSNFGVAVSVPGQVVASGLTFRAAVCAMRNDGTVAQFAGDETLADLVVEVARYCTDL